MYVNYMHVWCPQGSDPLELELTCGCKPLCGGWEPSLSSLQEYVML